MQSGLNARHHLHAALHQSESGAYWSLWVEISNLYIRNGANPSPLFNDVSKQLIEYRRRLLVRQECNRIPNCTPRYVNVAELPRHERRIIAFNAKTPSLEASREIR